MTGTAVVGRSVELQAVDHLLDHLAHEPGALLLEGSPGIGKTTVWRQVGVRAAERAMLVLSCRPVEAEVKQTFAALADLLEPVADRVLPRLPDPQRVALEVALLRTSPAGPPPNARAVGAAVLSSLRLLATERPLLLAIDDLQWLDRASAEVLAFALRRIGTHPVGVAAALRLDDARPRVPLALEDAFVGQVARMRLGPLSLSALHHVIRAHLDQVFPRPTLRRIADASGGNPFFALELARAVVEAGVRPAPGEPLPLPDTVLTLVLRRLGRLPARAHRALLVASATSAPSVELVRRAIGRRDGEAAVARARQARVLEETDGELRFAHPLIASAVYSSATADQRRDVHRRLARIVAAPEERARHLALAAAQPDERVARELDEAASIARRRGAPDAAGELQEQAARLTPADDGVASRRRRTLAAEHFSHAGDRARARSLLEGVLTEEPPGAARARALHLLGMIRGQEDSFVDAIPHLEEALAHAQDAGVRVAIQLDLAFAIFSAGDMARAASLSHTALVLAERLGDAGLIAEAIASAAVGEFALGRGIDREAIERALRLEDRGRSAQLMLRPGAIAAQIAALDGRFAEACTAYRELCGWATERGEESDLAFLLVSLARCEWWRGDFAAAIRDAEEAMLIAAQTGNESMRAVAHAHRAAARASSGDVPGARADLGQAMALGEASRYAQVLVWALGNEAVLELSLGDAAAAERALAPLVAHVEASGIGEPFVVHFLPDALEALIGVGQLDRAATLLERFAERAYALDRRWAIAGAESCRGLLAAARGDLESAVSAATAAVERWESLEMPVDLGRALLSLGRIQRRRGERRAARATLARALGVFQDRGAPLWAERAEAELRRIPIRRAPAELTETEQRVAALVAEGRTNREVARALFMAPKTVEANLMRVYGKLGIRSRAELGARFGARRRGPSGS